MPLELMLRYSGPAFARRYPIKRDDHIFWNDRGWVEHHGRATPYRSMGDAHLCGPCSGRTAFWMNARAGDGLRRKLVSMDMAA